MAGSSFNVVLNEVAMLHHVFGGMIDTGFLVFARIMGFMLIAPIFGRKDVPFNIKLGIGLILTCMLIWMFSQEPVRAGWVTSENVPQYVIQLFMNFTIGWILGFIGSMILDVVNAAGSLMNNQIGLSSAMIFDPSSRQQVALTEKLLGFIGLMVFFHIGGAYWILSALKRSFEVFPIEAMQYDLAGQIALEQLVVMSGNTLSVALQLVAPVFIVTLAVDLILGIINRMAQQIQIFQLSFALKPCIGIAVFLAMLPIFIKLVENYMSDYANLF